MARIERLLGSLTLEQKVGQLNMAAAGRAVTGPAPRRELEADIRSGRVGSVLNTWGAEAVHALQRLAVEHSPSHIPLLFGLDVLHGHRTIFPVPLAEAGLFDAHAWEATARAAAAEAAADGVNLVFAPMLDVARDPRWGRTVESPGEDPWVAGELAAAKARGFQGAQTRARPAVAATAKHLCGYGAVTAGREYASVDVSERTLHEVHLPPFAACVAAGIAAVMPAFIDVAGVPMTASIALLQGWLRIRQGFTGVVISDYNAIAELCAHGVAADLAEASALALRAGVDIDMAGNAYSAGLPRALERGLIEPWQLDACVRRVLELKERLGLFDDPYRAGSAAATMAATRALAREVAARAVILLTHRRPVLPLPPELRRVALIGPLASAPREMLGPWCADGRAEETVSILAGLRAALPRCRLESVAGVGVAHQDRSGIAAALDCARAAELVILCLGEESSMSGEGGSRAQLGLPGEQRALAEAVLELGRPVIVLLTSGRPLTLPWLFERADAVLATWFLGSEAGNAIADVLTGRVNPSGKLALSWPRHVGQVPIFFAQRPGGRPTKAGERLTSAYLDVPATPQFPFGHGLSYSSFVLRDLECTPRSVKPTGTIEVSISIQNDSAIPGVASVFLFVHDPLASIARPQLELKGVRRLALAAGERGRVVWSLPVASLAFPGADLEPVLEAGAFEICIGQRAEPAELIGCRIEVVA